jgi:hypothetical protein
MATNRNVLAVIPFFFFVAILQLVSARIGASYDDSEASICDTYRTCKCMQVYSDDFLVEGSHRV